MNNIIPFVYKYENKEGSFKLSEALIKRNEEFKDSIVFLMNELNIKSSDNGNIEFIKEDLEDEEYKIVVSEKNIKLYASSKKGMYYACSSLIQLVSYNEIECSNIIDKPKYQYRSFMIDVARHFFSKEVIMKQIDIMSRLKYNTFHFHVSDDQGFRVGLKKYPKIIEVSTKRNGSRCLGMYGKNIKFDNEVHEGYYTEEDIKEIVEYANSKYIKVIPEIDVPGHFMAVLAAYPMYHCFNKNIDVWNNYGVSKDVLCIGNTDTMDFIYGILKEVIRVFNTDTIHIGGDECPSEHYSKCPKCNKKMEELGIKDPKKLQGYFTNELSSKLSKDGYKVIVWNEAISETLDKNVTIQYWMSNNPKKIFDRIKNGNKLIVSPFFRYYADYSFDLSNLKKCYEFDPSYKKEIGESNSNIIGVECPLWTEWVRTKEKMEFMLYPRAIAVIESGWGYKDKYQGFINRLDNFNKILDRLNVCYSPKEYYAKNYCNNKLKWLLTMATCKEFPSDVMFKKYRG